MLKRKENAADSDGEDIIDIDFEFFDPNENDYLALKRLLSQLFQSDAELLHVSDLVDLVLKQPLIGTTVKTDGRESDPYAVLTVLNMKEHAGSPSIQAIKAYCLSKSSNNAPLHSQLQTLLSTEDVGLIVSERLINMPVQIVPPMYRMLADEIKWALEENEPYRFSHYLFITRTYKLSPEEESALLAETDPLPPTKKSKKASKPQLTNAAGKGGVYSFHPEDEYIQKHASYTHDFPFTTVGPREQDSFGLDVAARMMLVPAARFGSLIEGLMKDYESPT